jgi:DNA-binding response OmpR family regulator
MATLLLVDDDPELLQALRLLLTQDGHRVFTAQDGVLATSMAMQRRPDVIILDLGLPGGGGFTVLERLHSSNKLSGIPVLVLTGATDDASRARALQSGALEYLNKPANPVDLLEAVHRLMPRAKAA